MVVSEKEEKVVITVFKVTTYLALVAVLYYVYVTLLLYPKFREHTPDGYKDVVMWSDFSITLGSAVVLQISKTILSVILTPIITPFLKDQDDKDLLSMRVRKVNLYAYKTIYYTVATVWGYQLFKDTEIYPVYLGGTG